MAIGLLVNMHMNEERLVKNTEKPEKKLTSNLIYNSNNIIRSEI